MLADGEPGTCQGRLNFQATGASFLDDPDGHDLVQVQGLAERVAAVPRANIDPGEIEQIDCLVGAR